MSGRYPTMKRMPMYGGGGDWASPSNSGQGWPKMQGIPRMPGLPTGPPEHTYGYQNFLKRQEEYRKKFEDQQRQMREEREKARQSFIDRNMPKLNRHDRMMQPLLRYEHSVEMKKKREQRAIVGAENGGWYKPVPNEVTDPYKINSLSDVLFNSTAKNARYGTPEANLLGWLHQTGKAAGDYYKTSYVNPIKDKNFQKVISNSMIALNEDYALFRNPMKGVIVEADSRRLSGKVGLGVGLAAGGAKLATGIAAVGAATPQGALAALGIKGVAALLGGAIAAGAAAGGAAAVGTAAVQDPQAAMRGLKRGFGAGGEQKLEYDLRRHDGDRYGMFTNIMINIALDPVSWVSEAGNIMAQRTSQAMHNLMMKQTLEGKDYMGVRDMWSIANTSMDHLYAGVQTVKTVDRALTKGFFYANPLGLTWTFAKGTGKIIKEGYKNVVAWSTMKNAEGYADAFDLNNADKTHRFLYHMESDMMTKDRVKEVASVVQKDGESVIVDGKKISFEEYLQDFGGVGGKTLEDFAEELPDDLSPFRQFIRERRTEYVTKGNTGDRLVALIKNDLEMVLKEKQFYYGMGSDVAEMALEASRAMGEDIPDEVLDILISDLVLESNAASIVDSAMESTSAVFYDKVVRDLGPTASKLEVIARVEEEFNKVLRLDEGTDFATALMSIQLRGEGVGDIYVPILESAEQVFKMYDVTEQELMAYVARHTGALEKLSEHTVREGLSKNFLLEDIEPVKSEIVSASDFVEVTENLKRGITLFDKQSGRVMEGFLEDQIKKLSDYKKEVDISFWERPADHSPMVSGDSIVSYEETAGQRYNPLYDEFLKIAEQEALDKETKLEAIKNFKYKAKKGTPIMVFGERPGSKSFKSVIESNKNMVAVNELAYEKDESPMEVLKKSLYYRNLDVGEVMFVLDEEQLRNSTLRFMEDAFTNKKKVHIMYKDKAYKDVQKDSEIYGDIVQLFENRRHRSYEKFREITNKASAIFDLEELDVYDMDTEAFKIVDTLSHLWGLDQPETVYDYQMNLNMVQEYMRAGIPTDEIMVGDVFEEDHEGNIAGRELIRALEGLPQEVVDLIEPLLNIKDMSVISYGDEDFLSDVAYREAATTNFEESFRAVASDLEKTEIEFFLNTMMKVDLAAKDSKILASQIMPDNVESDLEKFRNFMTSALEDESLVVGAAKDAFGGEVTTYDAIVEQAYLSTLSKFHATKFNAVKNNIRNYSEAYAVVKSMYPGAVVIDSAISKAEMKMKLLDDDVQDFYFLTNSAQMMQDLTDVPARRESGTFVFKEQVEKIQADLREGLYPWLRQSDLDLFWKYRMKLNEVEFNTNALEDYKLGIELLEEAHENLMNSISNAMGVNPEFDEAVNQLSMSFNQIKQSITEDFRSAAVPMVETLPKGQFYKLQMNKRYQIELLAQTGLENHKDLLVDLFVEPGEVRELFDTLKALTLDETGYGYLQNAIHDIEQELWGLKTYGELTVTLKDIVEFNSLDPKAYDAVKEAIVEFSTVDLAAVQADLNTTTGNLDRLVENNLAMLGLDPADKELFMPAIVEYAEEMGKVAADTFIKLPGAHSNHMINLVLADIKEDFFPNAEAYDRALSAAYDLELFKEDIVQTVFDISEFQKKVGENVLVNEKGVNIRRALMTSPYLGAKDLSREKRPRGDSYETITPHDKMKASLIKEVVRDSSNLQDIGLTDALGSGTGDLDDDFENVKHYLTRNFKDNIVFTHESMEGALDILSEPELERAKSIAQEYLYKLNETNLPLYERIYDFVDSIEEYDADDPLFSRAGFEATQLVQAQLLEDMPASDIARELKYNNPVGTFFVEGSLLPFGLSPDKREELLRDYGILFHKVEGAPFFALSKVADSKLWDELDEPTNFYSGAHEFSLGESKNFDDLVALDNYMRDFVGAKTVFATDAKIPTRFNPEQMMNMFTRYPGFVKAMGGWEKAEEMVGSLARSRGYNTLFIASYDFQTNLVGRDPKTGTSYLPFDPARSYFNAAKDLIDHNSGVPRMKFILENSEQSLTVDKFLNALGGDEDEVLKTLKNNRDVVPMYVHPKTGRIREFKIENKRDLRRAQKMNLILVHRTTYKDFDRYLNDHKLQSWGMFGKAVRSLEKIQAPFKALALTSIGAPMRNLMDTVVKHSLYDNANPVSAIASLLETSEEYIVINDIAKAVKGDFDNTRKVERELKKMAKDEAEFKRLKKTYNKAAFFFKSYASYSNLDVVTDRMMRGLDEEGNPIKAKFGDNGFLQDISYKNPVTGMVLGMYGDIETISRLDMFSKAMDKHVSAVSAIGDVTEVHGDYTARSEAERILNAFLPFSGFPMRNLMYWMEHSFHHPIILRAFYNEMVDSWVQDDYSAEQLAKKEEGFADWMMQRGAHQQKTDRMSMVFKHNPSFFSALTTVPEYVFDPGAKLTPVMKNLMIATEHFHNKEAAEEELYDKLHMPWDPALDKVSKILEKGVPGLEPMLTGEGQLGKREHWMLGGMIPSLYAVNKFSPKEWEYKYEKYFIPRQWPSLGVYYGPGTMGPYSRFPEGGYSSGSSGRPGRKPKVPYGRNYGRYPGKGVVKRPYTPKKARYPSMPTGAAAKYYAMGKGNRALSTGFVTKKGQFMAGLGLVHGGNPMYSRDRTMQIGFGKYGAYLQNAPHGVQLRRLDYYTRSMYGRLYTNSGRPRMSNRVKPLNDPRSLMYRLQDMRYNLFRP